MTEPKLVGILCPWKNEYNLKSPPLNTDLVLRESKRARLSREMLLRFRHSGHAWCLALLAGNGLSP